MRSCLPAVIFRMSAPSARSLAVTAAISAALIARVSSQSPAVTDFYCENSYTNFAMGYQHAGTYVDGQGRVFAFGSESSDPTVKPWQPKQPDSPTQAELEAKYKHDRRQVGTIDARKLTEVRRWLADARNGSLSKKAQRGADKGSIASQCWIREGSPDGYHEVELAVDGDWNYRNTAPAAAELTRWLQSLMKKK